MKKGASKAEEQDKVKQEFKTHTEKVKEILREIVSADENIFMVYNGKYLNNTPESSGRLLDLLNDLAWIKNWHLDKKTLW
jgi:hypothetical protein